MKPRLVFITTLLAVLPTFSGLAQTATPPVVWRNILTDQLPSLGQGNWIVIADAAFPWSSLPGIQTIVTSTAEADVLQAILTALGQTKHLRPVIYTENELNFVTDRYANGVTNFRSGLMQLLGTREKHTSSHDDLVRNVNQSAQSLHVLVFKTTQMTPYSSVYIQLESAYWTTEGEKAMHDAMAAAAAAKK